VPQCLKLLKAVKVRKLKCNTFVLLYQIMSIACSVHQKSELPAHDWHQFLMNLFLKVASIQRCQLLS
jgi:hypothetical protein